MGTWFIAAAIIAAAFGGVSFASAQSERLAPPLLSPSPSQDCQPGTESLAAPGETTGSANINIRDELSRSKGVICPPAGVDPGISAPAVGGGIMPVIPPPGTPGGDPSVIPK
jgi:hypothetical protein